MKNYCILFTIFAFTFNPVFGEIKNGYEKEIPQMRESLKSLVLLRVNKNIPISQRRKIEHGINSLLKSISYYELTENLLDQFKIIAPDLYNEIDTLKDDKGRNVDVFVKFVPVDETKIKAWGTTYMSEVVTDMDACRSEYGKFTVSIKIWIVSDALVILAHELGHVKYQVPCFATYMKYYKENYIYRAYPSDELGHDYGDLSGKSAMEYVNRFQKQYYYYLKMNNGKIQNPLILMGIIKRNLPNT